MKTNSQIRQDVLTLMKADFGNPLLVFLAYMGIAYALVMCMYLVQFFTTSFCSVILSAMDAPSDIVEVFGALMGALVQLVIGTPLQIFVLMPIMVALMMIFLKFVRNEQKPGVGALFSTFKSPYYSKSVGVMLQIYIYTYLWSLLFIVPGVVKYLSYSLAPYILADNPNMKAGEAIDLSMAMMDGHKEQLFLMILGYMGLICLSFVACGIPIIFITPYYQAVLAKFYDEVKAEYNGCPTSNV